MKAAVTFVIVVSVACTLPASQGQGQTTPQKTPTEACPDTVPTAGRYINHSYGFSVVIPEGFKGLWNSPRCVAGPQGCTCMSDHGRIIPLTAEPYEPERHIEVFAGYAADLDEPIVRRAADQHLRWIRERSRKGSVSVRKRSSISLAGLRGQRVVVRYYDKKLNQWMVEDFIEAFRDPEVEYSLYLRTREETYDQDRTVFESVIATFALAKLR